MYRALRETAVRIPRLLAADGRRPGTADRTGRRAPPTSARLSHDERETALFEFVDALAELHAVDVDTLSLDGFARPVDAADHALAELDLWTGLAPDVGGPADPEIVYALAWLRAHAPETVGRTVLVQGDTGPGNFVAAERSPHRARRLGVRPPRRRHGRPRVGGVPAPADRRRADLRRARATATRRARVERSTTTRSRTTRCWCRCAARSRRRGPSPRWGCRRARRLPRRPPAVPPGDHRDARPRHGRQDRPGTTGRRAADTRDVRSTTGPSTTSSTGVLPAAGRSRGEAPGPQRGRRYLRHLRAVDRIGARASSSATTSSACWVPEPRSRRRTTASHVAAPAHGATSTCSPTWPAAPARNVELWPEAS